MKKYILSLLVTLMFAGCSRATYNYDSEFNEDVVNNSDSGIIYEDTEDTEDVSIKHNDSDDDSVKSNDSDSDSVESNDSDSDNVESNDSDDDVSEFEEMLKKLGYEITDIVVCTLEYHPVLGSNGEIYDNPCYARADGVNDFTYIWDIPKGENEDIDQILCTLELNPVMGSNGKTYNNPCLAIADGVEDFKYIFKI